MFVNCWGCHLTIKMDEKAQDWYGLDIQDKNEIICNANFCSKPHLDFWLKNDLIPLLVQEIFDDATSKVKKSTPSGFVSSGAFSFAISGLFTGGFSSVRQQRQGKCVVCNKDKPFRLEFIIYHNNTAENLGFCSLDCVSEKYKLDGQ